MKLGRGGRGGGRGGQSVGRSSHVFEQKQAICCTFIKCAPHNAAPIHGQMHNWVYTDELMNFDKKNCKKGTSFLRYFS